MMCAFHFNAAVQNHNKAAKEKNAELIEEGKEPTEVLITPIIGSEFFVCENHLDKSKKDNGYQIVVFAKNKNGYHNLAKMASKAYTDGFYYVPRIDKAIIEEYKEDLIVLSGNLQGEVPNKILNLGEKQAEEALLWWKEQFGDDFYIELMRHGQEDEDRVNQTLLAFARKHNVKVVATNNTYYINQDDSNAHDILLCVRDAEKQSTPIGRGRGFRFGLPNQEYYFKSETEMKQLFQDVPDAIINIQEIVDKIEDVSLTLLLPLFFVYTGLRTEIGLLNTPYLWTICGIFILVAIVGKFVGGAFSAKILGESWRDSLSIGVLMNTRGLMELIVLNIGYEMGVLPPSIFVILVIMALVTTFMTTPLLDLVERFFAHRDVKLFQKHKLLFCFGRPESGRNLLSVYSLLYGKKLKKKKARVMA